MKKLLMYLFSILFSLSAIAQETKYDPTAIVILDRMSDVIGDLSSCSYKTVTSHDERNPDYGLVKQIVNGEVHMVGPDKMVVNFWGPRGHRQCWYNGQQFAFLDYDEKNYGIVNAPSTIIATIDTIHQLYNVDFPAADFMYPAFTDDLIETSDRIVFVGFATINGKECFQILASNKNTSIQIWISNDAFNLPIKYVITDLTKEGGPQYDVSFSDWQVNPDIPLAMFEFLPPPGFNQVRMMSTSEK